MATILIYAPKAQNTFNVVIKDEKTQAPLPGASVTISSANIGGHADTLGHAKLINIPNGKQLITFSYTGYQTVSRHFIFPITGNTEIIILLN